PPQSPRLEIAPLHVGNSTLFGTNSDPSSRLGKAGRSSRAGGKTLTTRAAHSDSFASRSMLCILSNLRFLFILNRHLRRSRAVARVASRDRFQRYFKNGEIKLRSKFPWR